MSILHLFYFLYLSLFLCNEVYGVLQSLKKVVKVSHFTKHSRCGVHSCIIITASEFAVVCLEN